MSGSIEKTDPQNIYQTVQLGPKKRSIPSSWKVVRLEDIAEVKRGASPRPIDDSRYFGGDVGWVRISDMSGSGKYLKQTKEYLSKEGVNESVRAYPGQILLSISASVGKPAILEIDACIHDGLVVFRNVDQSVDRDYLYYALIDLKPRLLAKGQTGTQSNVNSSIVKRSKIPLPSLLEQRRIADILSTVDEQIQQTDVIIEKTGELREGLLQNLFDDLPRETDLQSIQLGPFSIDIPLHWTVEELENLNDDSYPICYGVVKPGDYYHDGVQLLNIEDVTDTGEVISDSVHRISEELHEQYSRSQIRGGEVVISVKGTVGRVVHLKNDIEASNISRDLARITPNEQLDPRWLRYCLSTKTYQDLIDVFSTGSTRASLNIGELRKIPMVCPPITEQREISDVIETVEHKLELEKSRKQKLQDLKRGLMQDLLTGKVRVNDISLEDN